MLVYNVFDRVAYEGDNYLGTFSSEENALRFIISLEARTVLSYESLFIQPVEVDAGLNENPLSEIPLQEGLRRRRERHRLAEEEAERWEAEEAERNRMKNLPYGEKLRALYDWYLANNDPAEAEVVSTLIRWQNMSLSERRNDVAAQYFNHLMEGKQYNEKRMNAMADTGLYDRF